MDNRLSASDMSSLFAERDSIHVNVGGQLIVEGAAPSYEQLVAHVENRLQLVPRFRQRIVKVPLGIENPVWADDPEFDIRRHVRHLGVPRPGRLDQLRDVIGRIMSEPLDFQHPLWQLYLFDGLRGRHAYLSKTHHALVDGVAAVDIGMILLDPKPTPMRIKPPKDPWSPAPPKRGELFAQAAAYAVQRPFKAAGRAVENTVKMPARTAGSVIRTAEAFTGMASGGPSCPKSPFNVPIGRDRLVAWAKTDLDRLKRARRPVEGSTVNDVVLSIAAGALRLCFEGRGEKPPASLVALVPVSIRREGEQHDLGNRISTILVPLPMAEPDPVRRLEILRDVTARLKESENARAASLIIEAAGWTPPTINRLLSSAMARPLVFNLVVSNVPGPQQPLYLLGRRIREIYPYVPLSPQNHAVSLGLISYDGRVFFGLAGDRDVVPDLDGLAASVRAAIREQPAPPRRPKPKAKAEPKPKPRRRAKAKPKAGAASKRKTRAEPRAAAKPKRRAKAGAKPKPKAGARRRHPVRARLRMAARRKRPARR
ncbi:MAG: wax ester/triacylglycerol synthase family O-acyltransferase [Actinobacteria bacterium]|nr:wax ester/triacylglycerol synthase family O-acyltransferase [Actinomycetota bacterium]